MKEDVHLLICANFLIPFYVQFGQSLFSSASGTNHPVDHHHTYTNTHTKSWVPVEIAVWSWFTFVAFLSFLFMWRKKNGWFATSLETNLSCKNTMWVCVYRNSSKSTTAVIFVYHTNKRTNKSGRNGMNIARRLSRSSWNDKPKHLFNFWFLTIKDKRRKKENKEER